VGLAGRSHCDAGWSSLVARLRLITRRQSSEVNEQILAIPYFRDFAGHLDAALYACPARVRIDPPPRLDFVGVVNQVWAARIELFPGASQIPPLLAVLWEGAASFEKAINQLFHYATWRKTKTAILIFSRNKDFKAVLSQIPGVAEGHETYKETLSGPGSDTEFRFRPRHPQDPEHELTLAVLAFSVPTERSKPRAP
jgi:hypothetical protein